MEKWQELEIQKLKFFRGFLSALSLSVPKLDLGTIERRMKAFGSMVDLAKTNVGDFNFLLQIQADKMFGTYDELSEMLIEGENDLILDRVGDRIYFRIQNSEAWNILQNSGREDWFKNLAKHFLEVLNDKN